MVVKPSSLAGRAEPLGTAWTTAFVDPEDSGPGKALAAAPLDRRIATARQHWTLHNAPTHYINVPFKGRDRGLILRCLLDALSIIGTVLVSWDALDFGTLAVCCIGTLHPTDATNITVSYCIGSQADDLQRVLHLAFLSFFLVLSGCRVSPTGTIAR